VDTLKKIPYKFAVGLKLEGFILLLLIFLPTVLWNLQFSGPAYLSDEAAYLGQAIALTLFFLHATSGKSL
jgi:hypothetical protein